MISVIIPSYKNPEYLDFCIESIRTNNIPCEIIVIIDGHGDMYKEVLEKYKNTTVDFTVLDENMGLPYATNIGVINANNNKILIINEDNVCPVGAIALLEELDVDNTVYAVQQIEPKESIFKFLQCDCGRNPSEFNRILFDTFEQPSRSKYDTEDAFTLPIFMSKRWYMTVGGWDTTYSSPFVVDLDFFLKLQLLDGLQFRRMHRCAFYHFGSRSTKKRDGNEINWNKGEQYAAVQFTYKWGVAPRRDARNGIPTTGLKGI